MYLSRCMKVSVLQKILACGDFEEGEKLPEKNPGLKRLVLLQYIVILANKTISLKYPKIIRIFWKQPERNRC